MGLDFIEGKVNLDLLTAQGFPKDKVLFAGVINGKNIWRTNYDKTLALLGQLDDVADKIVLSTSTSLLHVPYTTKNETKIDPAELRYLAFAEEKLTELRELDEARHAKRETPAVLANRHLFATPRYEEDPAINAKIAALKPEDYKRLPARKERLAIQAKEFNLPILPTTTIGSFPQTAAVRKNRAEFRKGNITEEEYTAFNHKEERRWLKIQEELGLDVLVHGEFERNDMVEYFGDNLKGFRFTENGWVQSYAPAASSTDHLGRRGPHPPDHRGGVRLRAEPDG